MATLRYNVDHVSQALYHLMNLAHRGEAETSPAVKKAMEDLAVLLVEIVEEIKS
jgi:hypothetical protein